LGELEKYQAANRDVHVRLRALERKVRTPFGGLALLAAAVETTVLLFHPHRPTHRCGVLAPRGRPAALLHVRPTVKVFGGRSGTHTRACAARIIATSLGESGDGWV
jgi:hypothetical protein